MAKTIMKNEKNTKYHSITQQNSFRTIGAMVLFTILAIFVLYPLLAAFFASVMTGTSKCGIPLYI